MVVERADIVPCAGLWLQVRVQGNQFSWITSGTVATTCEENNRDFSRCYIILIFADFQVYKWECAPPLFSPFVHLRYHTAKGT